MAEVGKIYWGILDTIVDGEEGKSLMLVGNESDAETWNLTLWNQNISSAIPWSSNTSFIFVEIDDIAPLNCISWFKGKTKIKKVKDLSGWMSDYHGVITNCSSVKEMFSGCTNLVSINNITICNTKNLNDLSYMFNNCNKLETIGDLFRTKHETTYRKPYELAYTKLDKVTTTEYMFYNCSTIDSPFSDGDVFYDADNTTSLTNMKYMCYGCTSLHSNRAFCQFNTENVVDMSYMFYGCTGMIDHYIDGNFLQFTFKNVKTISHMFQNTKIPMMYFDNRIDFSSVEDFSYAFAGITSSFAQDYFSYFGSTENAVNMSYMFSGSTNLRFVEMPTIDISNVTNTSYMFNGCSKLEKIFIKSNTDWNNSSKLSSSSNMFTGCTSLVGGNGQTYNSSKVNKAYAKIDEPSSPGYFSASRRKVTYRIASGQGTITGTFECDYGNPMIISVVPSNGYYTDKVLCNYYRWARSEDDYDVLSDTDTIAVKSYSINTKIGSYIVDYDYDQEEYFISEPIFDLVAYFYSRNNYILSIGQEGGNYEISGAGQYLYLDTPILTVDMNEGAISFLGWYYNNTLLSNQNPYTFTMPNQNYIITARFGEAPFTDEKVRQFVLTNGSSETYKLTSKDSDIFLNKPTGLGYSKKLYTVRYGDSEDVERYQFDMPKPKGSLYFHSSDLNKVYKDYNDFIRFSMRRPFILWYKIPVVEDGETMFSTYHLPVEITSIEKSEANEVGVIESGIEFYGTGFWKHTEINPDDISSILNDGDLDVGVEITAQKSDSTQFTNPVITFSTGGAVYGKCALEGTFTKIYLNTKDKEQKICLWNGSETELENPFTYIDFDSSDGTSTFPYPKLKNGKITSINFSYAGMQPGASNNVLVVYDKEYVSV